jgi:ABC-type uncharacterized transport system substrate-binding protein
VPPFNRLLRGNDRHVRRHQPAKAYHRWRAFFRFRPDVIFANGTSQVGPLLQATRTVPIIFTAVADPVGAGFVDSLARPGGNATGFVQYEYGLGGKWLELFKEIAPRVTRAAVLRDAAITAGVGLWGRHPDSGDRSGSR